jgi:beta-xylosidase
MIPIVVEAESGTIGSEFNSLQEGATGYITISTDYNQTSGTASYPGGNRTAYYEVTFPDTGTYDLFFRVRVGSNSWNDDSFFYGNGFGLKDNANASDWIISNGLAEAGFSNADDVVRDKGVLSNLVWKWVNLSRNAYQGGARNFLVDTPDSLTRTFCIGARENGLDMDKFAFGKSILYFTVENLDSVQEGSLTDPSIIDTVILDPVSSFETFINLVIPGDHPDATLTRIGDDFYTTGSSFNVTPKIYHSRNLTHWEVISQPVKASWGLYDDVPGGGIWGGHMVYYNNKYWHFFGRASNMYFVTADDPTGPWSDPTGISAPSPVPSLGQDNSIFIDDDNKWYLLVKSSRSDNWIVELGPDGHPAGAVLDLTWLNPDPYPYSWAEGPVMWKHDGYYYYSFARNVGGGQWVMRSNSLTDDPQSWTTPVDFFDIPGNASSVIFKNPNHCSPVVTLDDGTYWVFSQAYSQGSNNEWHGLGRQGILTQVHYNEMGIPEASYPSNDMVLAPKLLSGGIPWMVPKSDFFNEPALNPEWSFLGYTPENKHSLSDRPGWLRLSPKSGGSENTVIKNDAEHNYSLITRLDFNPVSLNDEAGIWIMNGLETLSARLSSAVNDSGNSVISFSFTGVAEYKVPNTIGNDIWLKLYRDNHIITGFYSANGNDWEQVGQSIDVSSMDTQQPDYNGWIGNQQGLYVKGNTDAFYDLYIYRDAYSTIKAQPAANQFGTLRAVNGTYPQYLEEINHRDWTLYAGVEFGGDEYPFVPDSIEISASCASTGGTVEVWLDSIITGNKIGECEISSTGSWNTFNIFSAAVDSVNGRHDVYLRFTGSESVELFRLDWFKFKGRTYTPTDINDISVKPDQFTLFNNYPNPFNPDTKISFYLPQKEKTTLKIFDILGREVALLFNEELDPGLHQKIWDAKNMASGIYFYSIQAGSFSNTKKMILIK